MAKNNPTLRIEEIHSDVEVLKNDISWIKKQLNSQDTKLWGIVVGVIISVILAVANLL